MEWLWRNMNGRTKQRQAEIKSAKKARKSESNWQRNKRVETTKKRRGKR